MAYNIVAALEYIPLLGENGVFDEDVNRSGDLFCRQDGCTLGIRLLSTFPFNKDVTV